MDHSASGNFILLFSDGEDNASHADLKQAVDMCQRANTAIYAFRVESKYSSSSGPKTLAELTSQTGGRVFFDDDSDMGIYNDLRTIEADLRNQYRLVYKPENLKHDGSFHRIDLLGLGARRQHHRPLRLLRSGALNETNRATDIIAWFRIHTCPAR